MNRTDVQGTVAEMWETRPARPRQDRQVAGVAAAIARRYDIDPVLVRVGFVVAAFLGIGAVLYLAGWVLLPEEPADPATARVRPPRKILVVALVIATIGTFGSLFGGGPGTVLWPALAVAGLLFLLHRSRAGLGVPASAPPSAVGGPSLVKGDPPGAGGDPLSVDAAAGVAAPTPPAWDPLGAAPFAWDLPEPGPDPAPAPRPRRLPVTPVTLGVALLAGGVTAVVLLAAGALTLANVPLLFGVVLAVLGSGLVVGAFVRSGRGLIPIAILMSALTWAVLTAPLDRWHSDGFDDLRLAPTTVGELLPLYERAGGEVDLDLRELDLAVPTGGDPSPVRTSVSLGFGEVVVTVPENADLTLTASAGIGRVAYEDREEAGPGSEIQVTEDLGADGVRSGRLLVLDVETGAGNVEVRRG